MLSLPVSLVAIALSQTADPPVASAPALTTPLTANAPQAEPPPSTYDKVRSTQSLPSPDSEGLWRQLVRTALALAFIVGLIYLLAKVVGPRLNLSRLRSAGRLKIQDRLPLDARHSLYLIALDEHKMLIASGEGGVRLIKDLSSQRVAPAFEEVLQKVESQASKVSST